MSAALTAQDVAEFRKMVKDQTVIQERIGDLLEDVYGSGGAATTGLKARVLINEGRLAGLEKFHETVCPARAGNLANRVCLALQVLSVIAMFAGLWYVHRESVDRQRAIEARLGACDLTP